MDLGLAGKTALITGGSKGIGFGVAEVLAAEGCSVHLAARDADTLDAAVASLEEQGADATAHAIDLSVSGSADDLLARAGLPDILVNNAGAIPGGDVAAIDEDRWRTAWDLKVFGYINMARAAYAGMKDRGHGTIVNVTGLAADKPDFNYIAGTSGNASLNAFTRALGSYALDDGIRVVAVSPGAVATDRLVGLMKTKALEDTGDESRWQSYLSGLPLGRAATVKEVADVVAFMASPRAGYVTGTVLTVDGGHGVRGGSFR
ncbi:MAG: short-chain dehydrogenase/reductase [Pseudomonadota bacterium]